MTNEAKLFIIIHDEGRRHQKSFRIDDVYYPFKYKYTKIDYIFYEDVVPLNGDETKLNEIINKYKSLNYKILEQTITG
jgi:hypothetical protein